MSGGISFWTWLAGVATITVGAMVNAALDRARDRDNRRAEMEALAGAFLSEIKMLVSSIDDEIKQMTPLIYELMENGELESDFQEPEVYKALLGRIGILGHAAESVVEFYSYIWSWHHMWRSPGVLSYEKAMKFLREAHASGVKAQDALTHLTAYSAATADPHQ